MTNKTVVELLSEVRQKKELLQAELAKVEDREAFLIEALGGDPDAVATDVARPRTGGQSTFFEASKPPNTLQGMSKAEALEAVIREAGRALKIGEMIDALAAKGYGTHVARNVQHNAIYTTLKRKPGTFVKLADSRWALLAWGGKDVAA